MTIPKVPRLPKDFIWHRLHSLSGIWLVFYLIIHLFTNSQAALTPNGSGFIRSVNAIHEIPFLFIVEISILAIPILIHVIWGIKYAKNSHYNTFGKTGHTPYLPKYRRNHAYTWQRITSWGLIFGIFAHIVHMRIIEYPHSTFKDNHQIFSVPVTQNDNLKVLSDKIGVRIEQDTSKPPPTLQAVADNFGAVELMMLRETFKSPFMIACYTLLVLTACFHGFNGLWMAMNTWGITLSLRSQLLMRYFTNFLMCLVAILGLSAIWLEF